MGGNPSPVECKGEPATSGLGYFNPASQDYIMRWIALASITLAVVFCLSDHTITVQSATVDRINGELLDITNTLEINVEGGKHDPKERR
jgi:hypothetical protein